MKFRIAIVGVGGTGSNFLSVVHTPLSLLPRTTLQNISFVLCDGDRIEKKNLDRQRFLSEDIGRYKSEVLASNLQYLLPDCEVCARRNYLLSSSDVDALFANIASDTFPVVISCVDNHAARVLLEDWFDRTPSTVLIDSANEYSTGEVVYASKVGGKLISPYRSAYFPEIRKVTHKDVVELSCGEINISSPQHYYTNLIAATAIANALHGLLVPDKISGKPFLPSGIFFFSTERRFEKKGKKSVSRELSGKHMSFEEFSRKTRIAEEVMEACLSK